MESKLLASRHGIECQSSGLFFLCMKYDLQCWEVLSLPDIQRTKKAQVLGSIGQILTQSFFKDLFIMQFAAACLTHTQWVIDFFVQNYEQIYEVGCFFYWNSDQFSSKYLEEYQNNSVAGFSFSDQNFHGIYRTSYLLTNSVGKNGRPKNSS